MQYVKNVEKTMEELKKSVDETDGRTKEGRAYRKAYSHIREAWKTLMLAERDIAA